MPSAGQSATPTLHSTSRFRASRNFPHKSPSSTLCATQASVSIALPTLSIPPSTKPQSHIQTRTPQLIRMSPVDQRSRHYHSSDAQGGNRLRGRVTTSLLTRQAPFQNVHHRPEHCLKRSPRRDAASRYARGQGHHRAGILQILVVLPGQISIYDLCSHVRGRKVHMYSLPAILPFRVREKAIQHFRIKVALSFEVRIEAAVR